MTPDEIDDWLGSVYTRTVNCDFREQQEIYDLLHHGISWSRYSVENDEVKVEHIDPCTVYYESSPYVRYRDPQTRLTRVAAAVKIALDGSVN